MRHGKTTALKCLPLATELLIVFLTADILWQLLCGRPPFSMWGFLLSGGLMTAGNSLFLQKPRRFWQILLLNVLLCAVWIPLLSRTLDLTYPPLLVIQVPLYLFPLCRGYHWGVTPVTVRHLHGAGEYMGLYGLFYLIVASFAPQLLDRVPVLLALLARICWQWWGCAPPDATPFGPVLPSGGFLLCWSQRSWPCWLWPPALCCWPPGGS